MGRSNEDYLEFPGWRDIDREHNRILEDYLDKKEGEYHSPIKFREVIEEAKGKDGVYEAAAVFFKEIGREHVYKDGNTSLALLITKIFLQNNGKEFKPEEGQLLGRVINNHGLYDHQEITQYLRTGEIDEQRLPPKRKRS